MAEMKNLTINGTQFTLPFAPSGYGLGVQGSKYITSWDALDSAVENGWYYLSPGEVRTVNGVPVNTALVHVKGHDGYHVRQELCPVGTNTVLVRMANARVFGAWECENPPMVLGVEYRTTERYNGAPVYTKLIGLGSMPANGSGKWVEHGTGSQTPIRVCGRIPSYTLPLRTPSDEITISVTSDYVLVFAPASNTTDWTGSTGQAQIWYTK